MAPEIDIILDDTGRNWFTGSPALRRSLNIDGSNLDLTKYVIRNMGFVRFRAFRSDARITLYPRFLAPATYESLVDVMVSNERARWVIEIVGTPNQPEIIPNLEDAVARIGDLATIGGQITREDFHREELSFRRLRGNPRLAPLAGLLRRWRASHGNIRSDLGAEFGDPALGGRTFVLNIADDTSSTVEFVGDGYTWLGSSWRNSMLGHGAGGQPDPQYGQSAAAAYFETHRADAPRLEFVEAVIRVPGSLPRRSRYERLLLPWRRGGSRFVSAVSVLRTSFATAVET